MDWICSRSAMLGYRVLVDGIFSFILYVPELLLIKPKYKLLERPFDAAKDSVIISSRNKRRRGLH